MEILKLLKPLFKKNIRLFLAMIFIGALGVAIVVGLMGSYVSLKTDVYGYISEAKLQDITIDTDFNKTSSLNKEKLVSVEGVESLSTRIQVDLPVRYNENLFSCRFLSCNEDTFTETTVIQEGTKKEDMVNVSIADFFLESGIRLGDTITITYRDTTIEANVYQAVRTPECICAKQNKWSISGNSLFGMFFIDDEFLSSLGYEDHYNQILVKCEENATPKEVADSLEETANVTFNNVSLFEDTALYDKIHFNLDPLYGVAIVVPIVIFMISLIVNMMFIYQIITKNKKEIGILLTMGYDKKHIYFLFQIIAVIVALFASVVGLGIGYGLDCLSYKSFIRAFRMNFVMPSLDGLSVFLAILSIFAVCMLATFMDTFRIVHFMTPMEAISVNTETKSRGLKLRGINPRVKIEINRILRSYKSFIISLFCISATFGIIFTGLSFYHSRNLIMEDVFDKSIHYDVQVFLDSTISASEIEKIEETEGVYQCERIEFYTTVMEANDKSESVLIYGIYPETEMVHILGDNHNIVELPKDGIVLDKATAENLGVKVNDSITIYGKEVKVSMITNQDMFHLQYMNINKLRYLSSKSTRGLLINTTDPQKLKDYFATRNDLSVVTFTADLKKQCEADSASTDIGIYIIIIIGLLMGMFIIFNMNEISMEAERRTYAVKVSMGFSLKNISAELIAEDLFKIFFSTGIGILLGRLFAKGVLNIMSSSTRSYPYQDNVWVYLITVGCVFVFMIVSRGLSLIRIKNLKLSELIKDKE